MFTYIYSTFLIHFIKIFTGVRFHWQGCSPTTKQRIYYANHSSHADFLLIWSALSPALRQQTRPVAATDYWLANRFRRFLINRVFHGILVERMIKQGSNPLKPILDALRQGDSLIIFPEGSRNKGENLLAFKGGLYHIATAFPQIEIVPIWIDNLKRVMPKGHIIPLPILCNLKVGQPIHLITGEDKQDFLNRAQETLISLASKEDQNG